MVGRALFLAAFLPLALTSTACSRAVDIKQTFKIIDLQGGYFDAGVVNGKNKLIPTVLFRIEKNIDEAVRPVSVNVLFKKIVPDGEEEWDDVFLQRVEFTEGNRTPALTVRPEAGVTGAEPRSVLRARVDRLVHGMAEARQPLTGRTYL
jgi:hypothetical protein